jgi:hypothetical protein
LTENHKTAFGIKGKEFSVQAQSLTITVCDKDSVDFSQSSQLCHHFATILPPNGGILSLPENDTLLFGDAGPSIPASLSGAFFEGLRLFDDIKTLITDCGLEFLDFYFPPSNGISLTRGNTLA